jgi:hypothetical protein
LISVNGSTALPTGLTTSVTSTLSGAPPYTIGGPLVPPGTDVFTITTNDGATPPAVLAAATTTVTIAPGTSANGGTITLAGVAKTIGIGSVPADVADTPAATTLLVDAYDADGYVITGTYASPVTVALSTVVGQTTTAGSLGAGLAHVAPDGTIAAPAAAITLSGSSEGVQLVYSGRAIAAATIAATTDGASSSAQFAPAFKPITIAGTTAVDGAGNPAINLYAPTGTGSTATFTAAELGFTDAPFSQSLAATAAPACGSFGALSSPSANTFTFSAVASPTAGICTITIADGLGNAKIVTATYTAFGGFGVS